MQKVIKTLVIAGIIGALVGLAISFLGDNSALERLWYALGGCLFFVAIGGILDLMKWTDDRPG